jgi:hypothetical protein
LAAALPVIASTGISIVNAWDDENFCERGCYDCAEAGAGAKGDWIMDLEGYYVNATYYRWEKSSWQVKITFQPTDKTRPQVFITSPRGAKGKFLVSIAQYSGTKYYKLDNDTPCVIRKDRLVGASSSFQKPSLYWRKG